MIKGTIRELLTVTSAAPSILTPRRKRPVERLVGMYAGRPLLAADLHAAAVYVDAGARQRAPRSAAVPVRRAGAGGSARDRS